MSPALEAGTAVPPRKSQIVFLWVSNSFGWLVRSHLKNCHFYHVLDKRLSWKEEKSSPSIWLLFLLLLLIFLSCLLCITVLTSNVLLSHVRFSRSRVWDKDSCASEFWRNWGMSDETYKAVQEIEKHRGRGSAKLWVYWSLSSIWSYKKLQCMDGTMELCVSPPRKKARLLYPLITESLAIGHLELGVRGWW